MSAIVGRALYKWSIAMVGVLLAAACMWGLTILAPSQGYVIIVRPTLTGAFFVVLGCVVVYRIMHARKGVN